MGARGYVVRGKDKRGNVVTGDGITTTEAAVRAMRLLEWGHCTDVAIFRVHDDGREERLPSYEEALTMRPAVVLVCRDCGAEVERGQHCKAAGCADPLAAIEAAERRLLEAGGWREDSPGWWNDALAGVSTISTERRAVALTIERRRLAAKGGA